MKIELNPVVVKELEERGVEDLEAHVNAVVFAYVTDQFIRKSEVAGMVTTKPLFRAHFQTAERWNAATREFEGVVVEGTKTADALFIPNAKLAELLKRHQVILVMKSPRSKKIETKAPAEHVPRRRESELS